MFFGIDQKLTITYLSPLFRPLSPAHICKFSMTISLKCHSARGNMTNFFMVNTLAQKLSNMCFVYDYYGPPGQQQQLFDTQPNHFSLIKE